MRQDGVTEYLVKKIMTDEQIAKRLGRYFPESHYSVILREDADVYSVDENGNKELLISFRKNVLPDSLCKVGIECLKKAAMKKHDNRGASAGVLNKELLGSWVGELVEPKKIYTRTLSLKNFIRKIIKFLKKI